MTDMPMEEAFKSCDRIVQLFQLVKDKDVDFSKLLDEVYGNIGPESMARIYQDAGILNQVSQDMLTALAAVVVKEKSLRDAAPEG